MNLDVKDIMKSYRIRIGKSQKEVADILGITRVTLSSYEEHPRKIPILTYGKMVELYGEDFNDYFFAHKLYKL